MFDEPKYKVGQWIRFLSQGTLEIGLLQYIRVSQRYPYNTEYVTDKGVVAESQIVEAR